MKLKRNRRPGTRRGRGVVIVLPSLFTLANLFFGMWSIVLAAQGDYYHAGWWLVIAGVLDVMDGLSARVSKTGTVFGAELDSLVDIVSFGVAPAVLMYFVILADLGPFAWMFAFGFVMCVALRLARYNTQVEDNGNSAFTGLPSPAAGMTLATYYPFTQSQFFQSQLADLPWSQIILFLIIALSLAMVSNVGYARLPRIGVRTIRGLLGLGVHMMIIWFAFWDPDIFFFPLGIAYVTYGLLRWAVLAFLDRGDDGETDSGDPGLKLHDERPENPGKQNLT